MLGRILGVVAASMLALCLVKPAAASTMTYTVNFGASTFTSFNGNPAPVPFVLGQFTLTMDPSLGTFNDSAISLGFLDPLGYSTPLVFDYEKASDQLHVGTLGSAGGLTMGTQDFYLRVLNFASGTPTFDIFLYSVSGTTDAFTSRLGIVHVDAVATTPIPAALPLFGAAIGGLGLLGWRRRKTAAA
jgi:hypothetical protein